MNILATMKNGYFLATHLKKAHYETAITTTKIYQVFTIRRDKIPM